MDVMWCHIVSLLVIGILAVDSNNVQKSTTVSLKSSDDSLDWWQTAVFYQIYPRSFMDSDNDGVGDLKGIESKLDHLKDAGVTATWLSPIFKSPQVDQGYDISDYRMVDPIFGSNDDLTSLIKKAHDLGIKVILDFVPNHTSDKHEWFVKSNNMTPGYEDYYIWHPKSNNTSSNPPPVPNNWISNFKGSAWEWSEKRQQYYYHNFAIQQPDLNYSNPKVVKEMKDTLTYWLDQGVDGFRIDAVPYLFEDPQFRDQPLADGYTEYDINNADSLNQMYIKDLPKTFDMIYQFREHVDEYVKKNNKNETKVLMTEAYSPIEKQMLYYGSKDGSRKGAHFTFNFNLISDITNPNFTIDELYDAINKWLVYIPSGYTSNWVIGNHDNHRAATRYGKDNVDGFNMLIAILPGVMVTYNGEEIGMEDGEVTCEEGFDPQATKNCSSFNQTSRDFERTPYHWDDSVNAGFNTGHKTWLPVSEKSKEVNLKAQNIEGIYSHYNIYKELMNLRNNFKNSSTIDSLAVIKVNENVLQIVRSRDDAEYILLFNIGDKDETIDFLQAKMYHKVVVSSLKSSYEIG
ncbi:unnamed protein product [Phaedon cochleariae]|uniref:alpha-glucosidase n=1 Tax=Phaedon cochleariae TaxID=80249 RepID=A0A9N9X263_PHACE|nr:unnamed protein product [Phaedon cochleariae]